MKINKRAFVSRYNTPIHQPIEDRQALLNKHNYKLKAWQRATQEQITAHPQANRHLPEDRQVPLNKDNYKLEDRQKIIQQQQQIAVQPETSRAYRSGRGFSEYSTPGKLLFAAALLSTLTTGKSEAKALPSTPDLCSKEKIFELFYGGIFICLCCCSVNGQKNNSHGI